MSLRKLLVPAVLLLLLFALPLLPIPEFWITQLNYIGMFALVGLGLVLLTGVGGLTSFGQAAFVGIGAYSTALICTRCRFSWLPQRLHGMIGNSRCSAQRTRSGSAT